MAEVGLYIHVPFCATKCGYCDFYSHVPARGAFDPLVDALLAELRREVLTRDVRVVTIFVGGGTPTLLPARPLGRLMSALAAIVGRDRPIEVTVEANPASLTDAKAAILREARRESRVHGGAVLPRPRAPRARPHPQPAGYPAECGDHSPDRLRTLQPRSDLRHPRPDAPRAGGNRSGGRSISARTTWPVTA